MEKRTGVLIDSKHTFYIGMNEMFTFKPHTKTHKTLVHR